MKKLFGTAGRKAKKERAALAEDTYDAANDAVPGDRRRHPTVSKPPMGLGSAKIATNSPPPPDGEIVYEATPSSEAARAEPRPNAAAAAAAAAPSGAAATYSAPTRNKSPAAAAPSGAAATYSAPNRNKGPAAAAAPQKIVRENIIYEPMEDGENIYEAEITPTRSPPQQEIVYASELPAPATNPARRYQNLPAEDERAPPPPRKQSTSGSRHSSVGSPTGLYSAPARPGSRSSSVSVGGSSSGGGSRSRHNSSSQPVYSQPNSQPTSGRSSPNYGNSGASATTSSDWKALSTAVYEVGKEEGAGAAGTGAGASARSPVSYKQLSRPEVEAALLKPGCTDGTYFLRPSTSSPGCYSLSVRWEGKVFHFRISLNQKGNYLIGQPPLEFGSLDALVGCLRNADNGLFFQLGEPMAI